MKTCRLIHSIEKSPSIFKHPNTESFKLILTSITTSGLPCQPSDTLLNGRKKRLSLTRGDRGFFRRQRSAKMKWTHSSCNIFQLRRLILRKSCRRSLKLQRKFQISMKIRNCFYKKSSLWKASRLMERMMRLRQDSMSFSLTGPRERASMTQFTKRKLERKSKSKETPKQRKSSNFS